MFAAEITPDIRSAGNMAFCLAGYCRVDWSCCLIWGCVCVRLRRKRYSEMLDYINYLESYIEYLEGDRKTFTLEEINLTLREDQGEIKKGI